MSGFDQVGVRTIKANIQHALWRKYSINILTALQPDMRYYADAADAVCVKNIRLCVKFMLEFTRLTRNVTI